MGRSNGAGDGSPPHVPPRRGRISPRRSLRHHDLVAFGCFAVRVITPVGDVASLSLFGPGECFGELALIRPEHSQRDCRGTRSQRDAGAFPPAVHPTAPPAPPPGCNAREPSGRSGGRAHQPPGRSPLHPRPATRQPAARRPGNATPTIRAPPQFRSPRKISPGSRHLPAHRQPRARGATQTGWSEVRRGRITMHGDPSP